MARTKNNRRAPQCRWTLDMHYGESWDTECDNKFQFTDGGPHENGMKYCCYCGRVLRVHLTKASSIYEQ